MGKLGDDKEFDADFESGGAPQGTDNDADPLFFPAPIRSQHGRPSAYAVSGGFAGTSLDTIIEKAHDGDLKSLRLLVEFFKPLIYRHSVKFFWMAASGCELSDLHSVGKLALLASLRSCSDPGRRATFVRYADIRIQNAIKDFAQDQSSIMSQTRHHRRILAAISKHEQTYIDRHGKWPTNEELAQSSGMKVKAIAELRVLLHSRSIRSMDEPLITQSGDQLSLEDVLASEPDGEFESIVGSVDLPNMLAVLTNREREAVELFFGLTGQKKSLRQIADMQGVSKSAAQQTRDRAVKKLQSYFSDSAETQSRDRHGKRPSAESNLGTNAATRLTRLIDSNNRDAPNHGATT